MPSTCFCDLGWQPSNFTKKAAIHNMSDLYFLLNICDGVHQQKNTCTFVQTANRKVGMVWRESIYEAPNKIGQQICSIRIWRCRLFSVPLEEQGLGRRYRLFRPGSRDQKVLSTNWQSDVPEARSSRDGDTSNEDYSRFFNFQGFFHCSVFCCVFLNASMSCSVLLDKFKIIITLRHAGIKIWRYWTLEKFCCSTYI